MTFDLEVMLRGNERVFVERIDYEREESAWTDADVDAVLRKILQAIDRMLNPGAGSERPVWLRGMSWIVSPHEGGVVIAFEIHSASAVAGPFAITQDRLSAMVDRVLNQSAPPPSTRVH